MDNSSICVEHGFIWTSHVTFSHGMSVLGCMDKSYVLSTFSINCVIKGFVLVPIDGTCGGYL